MELHNDEAMSSLYTLHSLIRGHADTFAPVQVWGCCGMTRYAGVFGVTAIPLKS